MTYTTTIYDDLRAEGWPAKNALRVARADAEAGRAGIDRFPTYADRAPVTIGGREYLLTVEPDPEGWRFGDDDVTGRVVDRERHWYTGHPLPVEPPAIALDERRAYQPADHYDPAEHLAWKRRQGMARHVAWLSVRADLLREAAPYVCEHDYGSPRCWIITLADENGDTESLCGVDLADGPFDRGYVFDVVTDLALELQYRGIVVGMKAGEKLAAATCHG